MSNARNIARLLANTNGELQQASIPAIPSSKISGAFSYASMPPGSIVQCVTRRTDVRSTWSSPNSGNGTTVSDLTLTITPRFANSLLLIQWNINYELHQDNVWLIHRDGSLLTDSGYTGYNSSIGNIRSSGVSASDYDQNEDSTPQSRLIQFFIPSGSLTQRSYSPAVRSSSTGNYTMYLNRTVTGSTGDAHESMISTGVIWEIMQ